MEREHAMNSSPLERDTERKPSLQVVILYSVTVIIKHTFLNRWTNKPCAVCSTGDERVDEEFMSVTCSNVERGVAILVHAVDLTAWNKMWVLYAEYATNVTLREPKTKANINLAHRFEWASGSEWTAREPLSCAEDSSHPDSEEGGGEIMYQVSD